jgi:hypothetical protein
VRLLGWRPAQDPAPEVQARLQHLRATGPTRLVLPFGVTLIARGWHDEFLWRVGSAASWLLAAAAAAVAAVTAAAVCAPT